MTTIIVQVEDEKADSLTRILHEIPFVKEIEIKNDINTLSESSTRYERVKKILDDAKGKNLFKSIEDPVEWQRQIRKDWDRDL